MANDTATLTWNANTEPDLARYVIAWGLAPGVYYQTYSSGTTVTTQLLPDTFFIDSDGLWYFAVAAIDTSDNVSAYSNEVSKRITRVQSKLRHRK